MSYEPAGPDGAGDAIWLVMGGGALKGLAHIGAWKAVQEAGIRVAGIIGTSIGAMVGAAFAGGRSVEEMETSARALRRRDIIRLRRRAVWINGIRAPSVFQGRPLHDFIRRLLPKDDWDELHIPLVVNVVDLATGQTVWLGHRGDTDISLVDSVYASSALPVLFPPAHLNGRLLVDGGVREMLPLQRASDLGATRIIAVDAGAGPDADARAVADDGLVAVQQRVFAIMAGQKRRDTVRDWAGVPLTFVRPHLESYGGFDFDEIECFLEEGTEPRVRLFPLRPMADPRRATLRALISMLALGGALGCGDAAPVSAPGTLTATVESPNGDEGAALLHLVGGGVSFVEPLTGDLYTSALGDTTKVLVLLDAPGEIAFRFNVADTTQPP